MTVIWCHMGKRRSSRIILAGLGGIFWRASLVLFHTMAQATVELNLLAEGTLREAV